MVDKIDIEEIIGKMEDEEIRDRILVLNREQLQYIKDSSHLIAYNKSLMLMENWQKLKAREELDSQKEKEMIQSYLDEALEYFKKSLINEDMDRIPMDNLIKLRKNVEELFTVIMGYHIELSYVAESADEQGIKLMCEKEYKNSKLNKKKLDDLIEYLIKILNDSRGDYNKYIGIISEIIMILPMRLVKKNYFTILRESILRNLKNETELGVDTKIEDYKKQFDSSTRDGYGIMFDYYFREVQILKKIELANMNMEELDLHVKRIMEVREETHELSDLIFDLGLLLNKIIVISHLEDLDRSHKVLELKEEWDQALKEARETLDFTQKIEKGILAIEEQMFSSLDEFNLLNNEAFSRGEFNFDELEEGLAFTKMVLSLYNDLYFTSYDRLIDKNENIADLNYIEQRIDSLIQYIDRAMTRMNNKERKIRMRRLLSLVELPFGGMDEFIEFIKYSLDSRVLSTEEINFKIDYILFFLDELEGNQVNPSIKSNN